MDNKLKFLFVGFILISPFSYATDKDKDIRKNIIEFDYNYWTIKSKKSFSQQKKHPWKQVGNDVSMTDFLPLTGGTLTGTLIGTSAVFGANSRAFIRQSISGDAEIGAAEGGELYLFNRGINSLRFDTGSRANFSADIILENGKFYKAKRADGISLNLLGFENATGTLSMTASDDFVIKNTGPANIFHINANTKAATFYGTLYGTGATFGGNLTINSGGDNLKLARSGFSSWGIGVGTVAGIQGLHIGAASTNLSINQYTGTTTFSNCVETNGAVYVKSDNGEQLVIKLASSLHKQLLFGRQTNYSYLASVNQGIGFEPLVLQPFSGNVGIGTTTPTDKLTVNGNIRAKKLIVTQSGWSDYVFAKKYKLRPLLEVENFVKANQHLPEVPSAKEVASKGINVGDTQALLLKKIEELTLYMIEMKKEINQLKTKRNDR